MTNNLPIKKTKNLIIQKKNIDFIYICVKQYEKTGFRIC